MGSSIICDTYPAKRTVLSVTDSKTLLFIYNICERLYILMKLFK